MISQKILILTHPRYNREFDQSDVVEAADIANAKNFIESDELDQKKSKRLFHTQ